MKIITKDGAMELEQFNADPIFLKVQIAAPGGEFSKPVPFLFDTGLVDGTVALLPLSLLKELGIDLAELAQSNAELADGSSANGDVISLASLRFKTIPSGQSVTFEDVKVTVSTNATTPIITLLVNCNIFIRAGAELSLLELAR